MSWKWVSMSLCAALACTWALEAAPQRVRADDPPVTPIEDPLHIVVPRIRAALAQSQRRLVRVSFWGESHVASDQFTSVLRARLQARYGDGGPGAFLPAPPAGSFYERRDVSLIEASGFSGIEGVSATRSSPLGAMGMALDARSPARVRFSVAHSVPDARVRVFGRAHPLTGSQTSSLELRYGDRAEALEPTSNADVTLSSALDVREGATFEIRAQRMRLFGVSIEGPRGVVVDNFGVSNARAEHAERWDDDAFQAGVGALAPDVVFLAYGTNEAVNAEPVAHHTRALEALIDRLRAAAPSAACVVIGPSNYPSQRGDAWLVRPRVSEVRTAFRGAAFARGCGYYDLVTFQGGESNLEAWVRLGLVLGDHVHMTDAGHERLGVALFRAITGT